MQELKLNSPIYVNHDSIFSFDRNGFIIKTLLLNNKTLQIGKVYFSSPLAIFSEYNLNNIYVLSKDSLKPKLIIFYDLKNNKTKLYDCDFEINKNDIIAFLPSNDNFLLKIKKNNEILTLQTNNENTKLINTISNNFYFNKYNIYTNSSFNDFYFPFKDGIFKINNNGIFFKNKLVLNSENKDICLFSNGIKSDYFYYKNNNGNIEIFQVLDDFNIKKKLILKSDWQLIIKNNLYYSVDDKTFVLSLI